MPIFITMPKLSDTMTEGTLLKWNKQVGDSVEMGEIIAEVETDKATMEMEAFDDGVIHEIYVQEGGKVAVGANMLVLLEEGEDPSSIDAAAAAAAPAAEADSGSSAPADTSAPAPSSETGAAAAASAGAAVGTGSLPPIPAGRRIKASPLAKKLASRNKLVLERIDGSGPKGRIVKKDIERVLAQGPDFQLPEGSAPAAGGAAPAAGGQAEILPNYGDEDEVIELSSMRKIIADRLQASKQQIPHFYLRKEVDAGPMMSLRKQINASEADREGGNKYSVNDFVLCAAVGGLEATPVANASWNGDSVVQFKEIGLAVAIAVDDGLVTPVIADAASKSLLDISLAVKDLATRAKAKKLKPNEFDGGTMTVSTLGAWGVDHFDAIVNPPQAVILSVGAITKKPVVNAKGEIVVGQRMWLGLSVDHRVIDGAVAAELLAEIAKRIEQPALMLV